MRPRPAIPGSAATPKAARAHLRSVLAAQEPQEPKTKAAPMPEWLKAEMAPAGRPGPPSAYTPELGERILGRMWAGEFPTTICRSRDMPNIRTVQHWVEVNPEFRAAYQRARHALADAMFDECVQIADDATRDMTANGYPNSAAVLRARLRVDTRKFIASKLNPRRYGERTVEHGGEVIHRHLIDRPQNETREQWLERRQRELALPSPEASPGPQDEA